MKKDNNKILLLDIINTNRKFAFDYPYDECSIMREMTIKEFYYDNNLSNKEIVIQNNSGFLVIEKNKEKYSLSSNLFIRCNQEQCESMILMFSELINLTWENMKEFYNKNGFFDSEDLEFYNYIDGDYSQLFFQNLTFIKNNEKRVSGILFISTCVIEKEQNEDFVIHTGFKILDYMQNFIEVLEFNLIPRSHLKSELKNNNSELIECFKRIRFELKSRLFNILKITNKKYKELFKSFRKENQDDIIKSYYYNNIPEPFKNNINKKSYKNEYFIDFQHFNKYLYIKKEEEEFIQDEIFPEPYEFTNANAMEEINEEKNNDYLPF